MSTGYEVFPGKQEGTQGKDVDMGHPKSHCDSHGSPPPRLWGVGHLSLCLMSQFSLLVHGLI